MLISQPFLFPLMEDCTWYLRLERRQDLMVVCQGRCRGQREQLWRGYYLPNTRGGRYDHGRQVTNRNKQKIIFRLRGYNDMEIITARAKERDQNRQQQFELRRKSYVRDHTRTHQYKKYTRVEYGEKNQHWRIEKRGQTENVLELFYNLSNKRQRDKSVFIQKRNQTAKKVKDRRTENARNRRGRWHENKQKWRNFAAYRVFKRVCHETNQWAHKKVPKTNKDWGKMSKKEGTKESRIQRNYKHRRLSTRKHCS